MFLFNRNAIMCSISLLLGTIMFDFFLRLLSSVTESHISK